ncbi:VIT1/CCC1 transporter family protein [Nostoc ellipsosporum NOK]|nr:VIT1/CCC1 transporter family protein [Nostoc ellipsosporum NOK]
MSKSPQSSPVKSDAVLADIIIGISDGLSVPFAIATGLTAARAGSEIILVAGLAATVIGAIGMGFSGYHTVKDESSGPREDRAFYANIGFTKEMQDEAMEALTQEQQTVLQQLSESQFNSPRGSGFIIGFSYLAGGLIPLAPFFFINDTWTALKIAAPVTLICLFMFGYLKNRLSNANPWLGAARMLLLGTLAAGAAFVLARIIT